MSISRASTPVWFDGFDVSAGSFDINFETGSPRQGGFGIPTTWVSNGGVSDFHDQLTGSNLLLAGESTLTIALASPNLNFNGITGGGEVIGREISFSLQPGTQNAATRYTQSGITIGSSSTLVGTGTAGSNFSVRFVEDEFTPTGAFLQLFDGNTQVGPLITNPAGYNNMDVRLFISDTDGNPWDGIGGTTINISINGTPTADYTKGGGGYTNNYLTLEGSANFVGLGLETTYFDNLTVFSDVVPEPSSALLSGLGVLALLRRRRN